VSERVREREGRRRGKRREEKREIATRVLLSEAMARISKRPSVSCFFLVLLIAFCLGSLPCQAEAPKATTSSGTSGEGKVVEITDRNYDALVHDGPWMIVVSASWCPHCKQLQPTWEKLAEKLEGKTKVGKIDGPEQKIVTKRLHIKGFPTIFHIDKKGKIRDYGEKSRDLEKLYMFAMSGYLQTEPFPWYLTPHSLFGQLIKAILELPQDLEELYKFLHIDLGMSDIFIIFSGLVLPLLGGVFVIGLMDLVFVKMHCRSLRSSSPSSSPAGPAAAAAAAAGNAPPRPHAD